MSLVGPWLSTTATKKRTEKLTKAKQQEFEIGWKDRNKFLRELNLPKQTFEQYMEWLHGKGKKESKKEVYRPERAASTTNTRNPANTASHAFPSKDTQRTPNAANDNSINKSVHQKAVRPWNSPPPTAEPAPTYTGTKIVGIAVLHKSCLQPVFSREAAEDTARMRR